MEGGRKVERERVIAGERGRTSERHTWREREREREREPESEKGRKRADGAADMASEDPSFSTSREKEGWMERERERERDTTEREEQTDWCVSLPETERCSAPDSQGPQPPSVVAKLDRA